MSPDTFTHPDIINGNSIPPPCSVFCISGIVTKPPGRKGRRNKLVSNPVHVWARDHEESLKLWMPEKASDGSFLRELEELKPDLCVTASYGHYLPKRFLAIPRYGTLNIHPSLLPRWRGAAPLQRALQHGDEEVGVSVLFSVQKMDAGPLVKQSRRLLTGSEDYPQLINELIEIGAKDLIEVLPDVWNETVIKLTQDESLATEAPKFTNSDSEINFHTMNALQIHNLVRALRGTFGTYVPVTIRTDEIVTKHRFNIVETVVIKATPIQDMTLHKNYGELENNAIKLSVERSPLKQKDKMLSIVCGDGSVIGITRVIPETRSEMSVTAYLNGLRKNEEIYYDIPIHKKDKEFC